MSKVFKIEELILPLGDDSQCIFDERAYYQEASCSGYVSAPCNKTVSNSSRTWMHALAPTSRGSQLDIGQNMQYRRQRIYGQLTVLWDRPSCLTTPRSCSSAPSIAQGDWDHSSHLPCRDRQSGPADPGCSPPCPVSATLSLFMQRGVGAWSAVK